MKLNKKKELAAKVLGIGKDRIVFNNQRLDEIKEAITKQDIRDLVEAGAILIREIKGTHAHQGRKNKRRAGSIRKRINKDKRIYMTLTRKLRSHLSELKKKDKISRENFIKIRKEIRARAFRSKAHMKERLNSQ